MLVVLTGISLYTKAQGKAVILDADTVVVAPPDSTVQAVLQSADSASRVKGKEIDLKPFKPNPTKAVILIGLFCRDWDRYITRLTGNYLLYMVVLWAVSMR